jgi:diketogulonate reductase-like aldo/keto reductase
MTIPDYTLNDGNQLPAIGFGTYPLREEKGTQALVSAIEVGYRLLDTAVNYQNEKEVGEAIRRSGVPREEIRVTSKIPGRHHGYDDAIASTHGSLERLGLDYLDLHLIHWPNPGVGLYAEAHGVSPGQVVLRWHVQLGSLPIPKSGTPERQRQNLDVFGFELTEAEMTAISALDRPDGRLFGGDPDTHEEM